MNNLYSDAKKVKNQLTIHRGPAEAFRWGNYKEEDCLQKDDGARILFEYLKNKEVFKIEFGYNIIGKKKVSCYDRKIIIDKKDARKLVKYLQEFL